MRCPDPGLQTAAGPSSLSKHGKACPPRRGLSPASFSQDPPGAGRMEPVGTPLSPRMTVSNEGADRTTAHPPCGEAPSWWPLDPSVMTPQRCTQGGWGDTEGTLRGLMGHREDTERVTGTLKRLHPLLMKSEEEDGMRRPFL